MEQHGVDPKRRRSVAREHVLAMRELWTQEEASFDGEHVQLLVVVELAQAGQRPVPADPHGRRRRPVTFRHIVEYCDGWMPIHGRRDIADKLDDLRRAADEAGRDMATIELGVFGCPADRAVIDDYAELGFTRCVLGVPPTGVDDAMRTLDRVRRRRGRARPGLTG